MTEPKYLPLALPRGASRRERTGFKQLCALLASTPRAQIAGRDHAWWIGAAGLGDLYDRPYLAAAAHTAIDLIDQGWKVDVDKFGALFSPPVVGADREAEKARVRTQEHLRRDLQLRKPSVRRFVERMERARLHDGRLVSVFNLMRDGRELAAALSNAETPASVIQPYVQIVDGGSCEYTGLALQDVWRYFRHTWSNAYATVPGRSMQVLVRDAATEFHAVIGIAAISSPVVQIAERDRWIGWETDQFVAEVDRQPSAAVARWLRRRIKTHLEEIYIVDLLRDGVIQHADLWTPNPEVIARLRADAERHRRRHHRNSVVRHIKNIGIGEWAARAETDLFRSKRSTALADTLEAAQALAPYLEPRATIRGLTDALADPKAKAQIRKLVRRARGERVGTVIADLTVCGAVAPYNALAAGKLVGALAVSPTVLQAYNRKYGRPSEIASAMAGRPVVRETRLAFIGTTSLYGTGSSQYNRLFWPQEVMGGPAGERMGFVELGRSRSFGTSHVSDETTDALVRLSSLTGGTVRVNSLFGEGVSPRLRKVRIGLSTLGWPANELLKHGRERIVYGVPLVRNLKLYALGVECEPDYLVDVDMPDADEQVGRWWFQRWGLPRAQQPKVIADIRTHRTVMPIRHGARVPLPDDDTLLELPYAEDAGEL
ncbi:Druantia anti-phage system protein DruA [Mycobacterium sp. SMC-17]|uniref:Druantia anti-phage system protein DruA n=1 Tax=Mycobacterium sp. SMC-17 TaxID=3381628 RepID=UPI003877065B